MIKSTLGKVKLTQPNYELCELLDCTKEEVDRIVKTGLVADLGAILTALEIRYGLDDALQMWVDTAEIITELHNEEKEKK